MMTEVFCSAEGGETARAWGVGVTSKGVEFPAATPLTDTETTEGAESTADAIEGERPEGTVTLKTIPELEPDAAIAVPLKGWLAWVKVTTFLPISAVLAPKIVTKSVEPTGPLLGDIPTTTGNIVKPAEVAEIPPPGAGFVTVTT
jgi:hypothetical protein